MENKLQAILRTHNVELGNPQGIRNFVLSNLVLLSVEAKNENTKTKCLEMLGKSKDVALFEERTTILIEHMTTEQIQDELRKKAMRLRGDVTTIQPDEMKDIT